MPSWPRASCSLAGSLQVLLFEQQLGLLRTPLATSHCVRVDAGLKNKSTLTDTAAQHHWSISWRCIFISASRAVCLTTRDSPSLRRLLLFLRGVQCRSCFSHPCNGRIGKHDWPDYNHTTRAATTWARVPIAAAGARIPVS